MMKLFIRFKYTNEKFLTNEIDIKFTQEKKEKWRKTESSAVE